MPYGCNAAGPEFRQYVYAVMPGGTFHGVSFSLQGVVRMDWLYLVIAGFCEIGWPLGLKISQASANRCPASRSPSRPWPRAACSCGSRRRPSDGDGLRGLDGNRRGRTFVIGVIVFRDSADLMRILSVVLIIAGVIGLKLAHR